MNILVNLFKDTHRVDISDVFRYKKNVKRFFILLLFVLVLLYIFIRFATVPIIL